VEQLAVAVGHDEQPFPEMGGSHLLSGNNTPFRIVPVLGKVTEDAAESENKVPWHVFNEDELGS
jgi:hypothetical protein